jgi:hypothetical protein
MKPLSTPARRKRRTAIDAALLLVIVLLVVQMWLLTATLESHLAGHDAVTLPAFLGSLVLFLVGFGVYRMVVRLDAVPEPEDRVPPSASGPWQI